MNAAALTALVDRWRPETHTFDLRAGEMTPTLQDVSMILGLPIQGEPLWANRDTIRMYTRVYLWYMISRTLFADSGGKLAHWCWLKVLTVLEHRWSWGTAALAYLYCQLDEACRRTGNGGIGGCLLLLSVWSWDRLSVGRSRILNESPWPHYRDNLDREPTWAFLWDTVSEMTSDPKIMYRHYTEELDTLTAEQVDWEPYCTYYHIGAGMADLNPKLDRQRQRKITNWHVHHRGHVTAFQHCLEAVRNAGHVKIVPHDLAAFNNYLQWFHQSTRIELVKPAYDDQILDDPIEFDEVAQSQHDIYARKGSSTSMLAKASKRSSRSRSRRSSNNKSHGSGRKGWPSGSSP
ncbi:hypothetical protein QYE76_028505 [Lolium multiflorum]|uniref:Aminotransferase-like plant mobile domain-containing protein n=1 Tax=Lolium multiflorum TaxID=4521 RepID=A0AAD8VEN5_LOLMU|nr:hypothetical protein QYE76_028505 [Lolium multiflorum]